MLTVPIIGFIISLILVSLNVFNANRTVPSDGLYIFVIVAGIANIVMLLTWFVVALL